MLAPGGRLTLLAVVVAAALAAAIVAPPPLAGAQAAVAQFTVNSTLDTGLSGLGGNACLVPGTMCTLRAAIEQANQIAPGMNAIIEFDLGNGPATIAPTSMLPAVQRSIAIDASSRAQSTILDGSGTAGGPGLRIEAGGCAVYGLTITGFAGAGIRAVDAEGLTIGGPQAGKGNTIYGNGSFYADIEVTAPTMAPVHGVVIEGNTLGLPADGSTPTSATAYGLKLSGTQGAVVRGNTISGHRVWATSAWAGYGIFVDKDALGTLIVGNRIGTDHSGTAARANVEGVWVRGSDTTIGGTTAAARNLISGNERSGVTVNRFGSDGSDLVIANARLIGNYIGTDITGSAPLANGTGVVLTAGEGHRLGGTAPGSGNLISGNGMGVSLGQWLSDVLVQGNLIGTNADGTAPLSNTGAGIHLQQSSGNLIGGATAAAANVIAGNGGAGIASAVSKASDPPCASNRILGNYIGVGKGGEAIGNGLEGVRLGAAAGTRVGGRSPGEGNRIANNGRGGVVVFSDPSVGNTIVGNAIFANAGLGIDLGQAGVDGPTPNDPGDQDSGPNQWQNYPELSKAWVWQGQVTVAGVLASAPDATYLVDLYWNATCDASGYGEGERHLGSTSVTTDTSGLAAIAAGFAVTLPAPGFLVATATDADGNTSEFSACLAGSNQPPPTPSPTPSATPSPTSTPPATGPAIYVPQVSRQ